MPSNPKVRALLDTVCDKFGFRFAVELHHALRDGRNDEEVKVMVRMAAMACPK